jgi:hypothetical protein
MTFDIEQFGKKLSNNDLIEIIKSNRDEESVPGALKEFFRRKTTKHFEICKYVLDDNLQRDSIKKTIVAQLGTECLSENQELLLHNLKTKNASLFNKIVQSLGKIGDEHVLKRLEEIESSDVNVSDQSLVFAKSLISYRLRLNSNLIKLPSDSNIVKITKGIPINIQETKTNDVRESLIDLKKYLPCASLVSEGSIKLPWPSVDCLMMFTDNFHEEETLKSIQENNALPLVILEKASSLGVYFLSHYFFTHPSEDDKKEVVLLGMSTGGTLTNVGKVQITEKGFEFKVVSVDSLYSPPIEIEWIYDPNKRSFKFIKAISSTKVESRKTRANIPHKVSLGFGRKIKKANSL